MVVVFGYQSIYCINDKDKWESKFHVNVSEKKIKVTEAHFFGVFIFSHILWSLKYNRESHSQTCQPCYRRYLFHPWVVPYVFAVFV